LQNLGMNIWPTIYPIIEFAQINDVDM